MLLCFLKKVIWRRPLYGVKMHPHSFEDSFVVLHTQLSQRSGTS